MNQQTDLKDDPNVKAAIRELCRYHLYGQDWYSERDVMTVFGISNVKDFRYRFNNFTFFELTKKQREGLKEAGIIPDLKIYQFVLCEDVDRQFGLNGISVPEVVSANQRLAVHAMETESAAVKPEPCNCECSGQAADIPTTSISLGSDVAITRTEPKKERKKPQKFICEKCPFHTEFPNEEVYRRHIDFAHLRIGSSACSDSASQESSVESVLEPLQKFQCKVCLRLLKTSDSLRRHGNFWRGYCKRQYKCTICKATFETPSELNFHSANCQPQKKNKRGRKRKLSVDNVKKEDCQPQKQSKRGRKPKLSVNNGEKKENCPLKTESCLKCLKSVPVRYFRFHLRAHRGKPFKCGKCGLGFRLKRFCDFHKKTVCYRNEHLVRSLRCPECGEIFRKRFAYQQHFKTKHRKNIGNEQPNLICEVCNKVFGFPFQLARHKRVHLWSFDLLMNQRRKCPVCGESIFPSFFREHSKIHKSYRCNQCDETFPFKFSLMRHKKTALHLSGVFQCFNCGQKFKHRTKWKKHTKEARHSGRCASDVCHVALHDHNQFIKQMPFHSTKGSIVRKDCPKCGKSISYASFYRHVRSHFAEKKYKQWTCDQCGRIFGYEVSLKGHQQTVCYREKHLGRFRCPECEKTFSQRRYLMQHRRLIHQKWPVEERTCNICKKVYKNPSCLSQHRLKSHPRNVDGSVVKEDVPKPAKKVCQKCGKSVSSDYFLTHMRSHDVNYHYMCDKCGEIFRFKSTLYGHKKTVCYNEEQIGCYKCPECEKTFILRFSLMKHRSRVHRKRPIEERTCDICKKRFDNPTQLARHKLTSHSPNDDGFVVEDVPNPAKKVCRKCGETISADSFRSHLETHGQYICDKCGKLFLSHQFFSRHRQNVCYKEALLGCFKCPECEKTFNVRYCLIKHLSRVHRKSPIEERTCNICKKVFGNPSQLARHRLTSHPSNVDGSVVTKDVPKSDAKSDVPKPAKKLCLKCGKTISADFFRRHMQSHDVNNQYMCDRCGKIFPYRRYLYTHQQTVCYKEKHLGCFRCPECEKTFNLRFYLIKHRNRVHRKCTIEERTCDICKKPFKNPTQLARHRLASHRPNVDGSVVKENVPKPAKKKVCLKCGKSVSSDYFLKHMRSHDVNYHYMCDKCGEIFRLRNTLKYHKETVCYNEEQIGCYKCPECEKTFNLRYSLLRHRNRVHRKKPIEERTCDICKKVFKNPTQLTRHRRMIHPPNVDGSVVKEDDPQPAQIM